MSKSAVTEPIGPKLASLLEEPICEWSRKQIEKHFELLSHRVVGVPRYVCVKCGRAAASRRNLCKAQKMGQ